MIDDKRKLWIDSLRGIAIIMVVYGHCVGGWSEFFEITSPVKMPLFFVISAYLFNTRNGNQYSFFKNILLKLVVPWMVLGMFPYVHPVERFVSLLTGKALWFMPSLILAEIMWFYICKLSKSLIQKFFWCLLLCILGFTLHHLKVFRYPMVDTAMVAMAFFALGHIIRVKETSMDKKWEIILPIFMIIYIFMVLLADKIWPNEVIDVHLNRYFNIPYCFFMISIGCITLFTFFRRFEVSSPWIVYIGQNTLLIYLMHGFTFGIFNVICRQFTSFSTMSMQIYGFIKTLFALGFCCVLALFINKFIPEIVGKKRTSTKSKSC